MTRICVTRLIFIIIKPILQRVYLGVKQEIISNDVIYEENNSVHRKPQRNDKSSLDKGSVQRGSIPPSNTTLLNRFENVQNWEFLRPDNQPCTIHIGPILSGEKLIDDPQFKAALFERFPQAIGGEMEGAGLVAASGRVGTAWTLIKIDL